MTQHANIPVFIPHLGCPNQCVFCNQRSISGVEKFNPESVIGIIEEALFTIKDGTFVEIAFFGGSFTGIERSLMIRLLEIAKSYVISGRVSSIRCSTRPDYINQEIIEILKKYGVNTIELGLQSASDNVLSLSGRGHDFKCEENACKLILDSGISLVGQMMVGLPGSSIEDELKTADFIIKSGASAARIYPTVVFYGTPLSDMTEKGIYQPLETQDAVRRSALVLDKFLEAGVDVIRIGLCASENLVNDSTYHAGPNHPALGELVENELYYIKLSEKLKAQNFKEIPVIHICVAKGALSKAIGQRKINKTRLCRDFSLKDIKFTESDKLSGYDFFIELGR